MLSVAGNHRSKTVSEYPNTDKRKFFDGKKKENKNDIRLNSITNHINLFVVIETNFYFGFKR